MRAAFGDQYDAYLESRATPVDRRFSLKRAIKNKEYRASLAWLRWRRFLRRRRLRALEVASQFELTRIVRKTRRFRVHAQQSD